MDYIHSRSWAICLTDFFFIYLNKHKSWHPCPTRSGALKLRYHIDVHCVSSHWHPLCIILFYHTGALQKMRSETTLLNPFAHTMQTYTNHILTWQCWSSSSSLHCLAKTHKIIIFFLLLFIYGNKDLSLWYTYVLCLKVKPLCMTKANMHVHSSSIWRKQCGL